MHRPGLHLMTRSDEGRSLTNEKGQELQVLLCLLLLRVICLRCHDLLGEELGDNKQDWQHQIGDGLSPTQRGLAIFERQQPGTSSLHRTRLLSVYCIYASLSPGFVKLGCLCMGPACHRVIGSLLGLLRTWRTLHSKPKSGYN